MINIRVEDKIVLRDRRNIFKRLFYHILLSNKSQSDNNVLLKALTNSLSLEWGTRLGHAHFHGA